MLVFQRNFSFHSDFTNEQLSALSVYHYGKDVQEERNVNIFFRLTYES